MAPKKPTRRVKKHSVQSSYSIEVCDRVQVTTIISKRDDPEGNIDIDVMNCVQKENHEITPLQGAVSLGHLNICKRLLDEGVSVMSSSMVPDPLCLSLQKGYNEISELLIHYGANVKSPFGDFYPMFFALDNRSCQVPTVKLVIDAGFPIDAVVCSVTRETALHVAVSMGHEHVVRYLLGASANLNVTDIEGLTPLHVAVQKENLAMIDLLVSVGGANLNSESKDSCFTPIFYAITSGNCEIVSHLISLGADIHHACTNKLGSMMPLHYAAFVGQLKVTQLLLDKGADVNRQNPITGEIALHSAARGKSESVRIKVSLNCITELLVKHGSDLKARQKNDLTPLQVAVKARNFDIAKLLITKGSELNNVIKNKDDTGCTSFHLISKTANHEMIKLAIDYGADCLARDCAGLYPSHHALMTSIRGISLRSNSYFTRDTALGSPEELEIYKAYWKQNFPFDLTFKMVKQHRSGLARIPDNILSMVRTQIVLFDGLKYMSIKTIKKALAQGAEVKCCSTDIPFPLHHIASKGNGAILKLFLNRGAVVNVVNKQGETPLHTAARVGSAVCCKILLEYGAVYNGTTAKCPKTPLCLAKEFKSTKVVQLLESVGQHFKGVKKNHIKKLNPEMKIFNAVFKCTASGGLTLLATATKYCSKEKIERLAALRFFHCS